MNTPITKVELKTILAKHAAWLKGEDGGERADLSDADLSGADLSGADLSGANLSGADLSGADLRRANLWRANLWGADLSGADLSDADLSGANLRRADLSGADLRRANLWRANLRRANLWRANLWGANLSDADLRDANLILAGQDIRGYLFYASINAANVVVIRAGCREFVGMAAARAHWSQRHTEDEVLHADCLSLVDRIERMATVRGWMLEPE